LRWRTVVPRLFILARLLLVTGAMTSTVISSKNEILLNQINKNKGILISRKLIDTFINEVRAKYPQKAFGYFLSKTPNGHPTDFIKGASIHA
jgi:hypothetical protein